MSEMLEKARKYEVEQGLQIKAEDRPAFHVSPYVGSYFLARYTAEKLGNNILNKVTGDIAKQIARQSASSQLGGGAEAVRLIPCSLIFFF